MFPETQDSAGERRLPLRRPLSKLMRWVHCEREESSLELEFFEERKLVICTQYIGGVALVGGCGRTNCFARMKRHLVCSELHVARGL